MKECPDVGKTIEAYVQDRNVGADTWRRTGVLIFDGNVKLKQKATYEGIRLHLQEVYNRHFLMALLYNYVWQETRGGSLLKDTRV